MEFSFFIIQFFCNLSFVIQYLYYCLNIYLCTIYTKFSRQQPTIYNNNNVQFGRYAAPLSLTLKTTANFEKCIFSESRNDYFDYTVKFFIYIFSFFFLFCIFCEIYILFIWVVVFICPQGDRVVALQNSVNLILNIRFVHVEKNAVGDLLIPWIKRKNNGDKKGAKL